MFSRNTQDKVENTAETMVNEGAPIMQDVKDSARRIKGDARDAAQNVKGEARDAAHSVRDDLEDVARRTGRQVREFADHATHNVSDFTGTIAERVRANPVQWSLGALAVGFIVGMMKSRR